MNDHLSVETPEQINLNFQKAGIGSRFYAALIDTSLLLLIVIIGRYFNEKLIFELQGVFGNWLAAIGGIVVFALFWGYYMAFEIITNGQSPGKRLLGLRVMKVGGYPISFADSAIRNLVRIVDFLPFCYCIGMTTMLINGNWQRLGDLAAGTLVVKTSRKKLTLTDAGTKEVIPDINISPQEFLYVEWIQPDLITDTELSMIREYLSRRSTLSDPRRFELAETIGNPIVDKMGDDSSIQGSSIQYDRFLEEVYALKTSEITRSVSEKST